MNESEQPSCLHCGSPIPTQATGRTPKFCSPAHRVAFSRKLRGDKSNKSTPHEDPATPPTESSQTPPDERVIGTDGVDYSDPYAVLPPEIAVYMPIQSHQKRSDVLQFERVIRKEIPFDPHLQPKKKAFFEQD